MTCESIRQDKELQLGLLLASTCPPTTAPDQACSVLTKCGNVATGPPRPPGAKGKQGKKDAGQKADGIDPAGPSKQGKKDPGQKADGSKPTSDSKKASSQEDEPSGTKPKTKPKESVATDSTKASQAKAGSGVKARVAAQGCGGETIDIMCLACWICIATCCIAALAHL